MWSATPTVTAAVVVVVVVKQNALLTSSLLSDYCCILPCSRAVHIHTVLPVHSEHTVKESTQVWLLEHSPCCQCTLKVEEAF